MRTKKDKLIYFLPRVLSIFFICFLALFSLDVFGEGYGFWGTAIAFLMHNIPVFILTVVLVISWKREIVGGIIFMAVGFLYTANIFIHALRSGFEAGMIFGLLLIADPAFLIGILFLINWRRKNTLGK